MRNSSVIHVLLALVMIPIGPAACSDGGAGPDAAAADPDDAGTVPEGTEGGRCFKNATCHPGLVCASDLCVRLPDAGAVYDTGADTGPADAGEPDTGLPDAGQPDAGQPDAGQPDAGVDTQAYPRHGAGCTTFGHDPARPDIDDPLKGSTKGRVVFGGELTAAGYKLPGTITCEAPYDTPFIEYKIPTAQCGRVEFDATGLDSTFTCRGPGEDIFGMYDAAWVHPSGVTPRDNFIFNPYRVSLVLSCDDPTGACTPSWAGALFHAGNDIIASKTDCRAYAPLSPFIFDPAKTYHFTVTWSGDAQETTLLVNGGTGLEGFGGVMRATCGDYIAYDHTITIGGTPAGQAPANAVFSNVKIWWFQP